MSSIAKARAQLRAAMGRCVVRPPDLETKVQHALSLLETAQRLGRGHDAAVAEAVKLLVELERQSRATSRQLDLFAISEGKR